MEINNRQRHIEKLIVAIDNIYGKPTEIFKRGFLLGLASGAGWILGATIVVLLISFLLSKFGSIPFLGDILEKIDSAVPTR